MAIFNEVLEGGLNDLIAKRLAMQGGAPAPSVMPEIVAGLTLENDRPEYGWLKRELLAGGYGQNGATAAQLSFVQFSNPSGSNVLIVVKWIRWTGGAAVKFWRAATSLGGTARNSQYLDFRSPLPPGLDRNTVGTIFNGASAGTPPAGYEFHRTESTAAEYDHPIVLPPGSSLVLQQDTVNQALTVNLRWTERYLLPNELA